MVARATGANVFLRGAFQTADEIVAPSGYLDLSFYSGGVSDEQNFLDDVLLGSGRDPEAPQRGAVNVTGTMSVPIDFRRIGFWLKSLFGATQSDSALGARGYINFAAQPAPASTITLDGQAWTFVASGATGEETNIGVDLEATLDALVSDLNSSVVSALTAATYSRLGDRLVISHDTATTAGNTYTLVASAASNGTVSASTLTGGGYYNHLWYSGSATVPTYTLETYHSDLSGNNYAVSVGNRTNSITIGRTRDVAARMDVEIVGFKVVSQASSAAGTPTALEVANFSQFNGVLLGDERKIANLVSGNLVISNNLDVVPGLRDDPYIDGADPGQVGIQMQLVARFSENALKIAADSETPMDIRFGFYNSIAGEELIFRLHEVHLPKPRREIAGPGGIEATYDMIGAREASVSRSITCQLINDVASY